MDYHSSTFKILTTKQLYKLEWNRGSATVIHESHFGEHPVSGNRDFGYTYNADRSYTFYTREVDRLTSADATAIHTITEFFGKSYPLEQADKLWTSFQSKIVKFVQMNKGSAPSTTQEILRPNWQKVKDVLDGKAPLSTLRKDCN